MIVQQLSVFVENRPGKLVDVIEALGRAGIDLRALSIAETADYGILRVIVNKPDEATKLLQDGGYIVKLTEVLAVSIDDTPGSLGKVLRILSDGGVSVEYTYAFVGHGADRAFVVIRVEDMQKAVGILTEKGVAIAASDEIYR
jgi:hypothetical protein